MPIYSYSCDTCCTHELDSHGVEVFVEARTFTVVKPMSQSSETEFCPYCDKEAQRRYDLDMPAVMNHSLPDGTRRFDGLRRQRELEKAKKAETDKGRKAKLENEIIKAGR